MNNAYKIELEQYFQDLKEWEEKYKEELVDHKPLTKNKHPIFEKEKE